MTTSRLQTRIGTTIAAKRLFKPGDTLIVGLSGGADSTALLDLLATLPGYSLRLVAAHLNHCLRGEDSDGDELFCRDLAARYAIPFESRRVDVRAAADAEGLNLEDAGRRARFEFFDELATRWGAAGIVLAHHADDQAETVLMRLLRGSGATGLAGMAWRNGRGHIRPLLEITRAEIEVYLTGRGLAWREDASNSDTAFLRNRIRHELLPLLESYNPAVRTALAATADILAEEDALLDRQSLLAAGQLCCFTADAASCDIDRLQSEPLALQRRIIRRMLAHLTGSLEQISHGHIERILQLPASNRPNLRIALPLGLAAVREYGTLTIRRAQGPHLERSDVSIPGPGDYLLPDGSRLLVEIDHVRDAATSDDAAVSFDIDRAPFPWHVRTFRPGDRIRPLGMKGRKKVKDLYIDEKIPLVRRAQTPLLFSGDELIWVVGLRTSHTVRIDSLSTRIATCRISS